MIAGITTWVLTAARCSVPSLVVCDCAGCQKSAILYRSKFGKVVKSWRRINRKTSPNVFHACSFEHATEIDRAGLAGNDPARKGEI